MHAKQLSINTSFDPATNPSFYRAVYGSNPGFEAVSTNPEPFRRTDIQVMREEVPSDICKPLGSPSIHQLAQECSRKPNLVQPSTGEWLTCDPAGNPITPIRTHSCGVPMRQEVPNQEQQMLRLAGNSPEHQTNKRPSSRGADMGLSSEGSGTPVPKRHIPSPGHDLPRPHHESPRFTDSNGNCWSYHQIITRHSGIAQGTITANPANPRNAILLDVHGTRWIQVLIRYGTERNREDTLGNSPISIMPAGIPHGRFKAIHAQPARGHCLRRYELPPTYTAGSHTYVRLGNASNDQCEVWQCDYSREHPEDIHQQQNIPRQYANLQPGGVQRPSETCIYHNSHQPDVSDSWGYPGRERANYGRGSSHY